MADPRRPRIIRSRPGTAAGRGPSAQEDPVQETHTQASHAQERSAEKTAGHQHDADAGPAAKARATSGKVSVTPLPTAVPSAQPGTPASGGRSRSRAAAQPPAAQPPVQEKVPEKMPEKATGKARNKPVPGAGINSTTARGAARGGGKPTGRTGIQSAATGEAGGKPRGSVGASVLAFPEPAHKRRRRRAWLGVAGVAVVLAVVMALALFSPVLAVKQIVFDGASLVPQNTLQAAVAPLLGRPLPQVTQEEVQKLLAKVPQLKSSSVEARPPSTLLVHVVERVPVALLRDGKGWIQVDQDGVSLGKVPDQSKVPLPLIDGGTAAIGKNTFRAITAVLATLPKSVLSKLASASAKSPDDVQLQMVDGQSVVWGNATDMELKAQVLAALIAAPAPTPVPQKNGAPGAPLPPVKVYDVSAPLHPVTR